jgi:putative SOS response-associated peptidase YedK
MCGRFRLGKGREALREHFGSDVDLDWSPRYNIAPTQPIPSLRQNASEPKREVSLMRWGLIPISSTIPLAFRPGSSSDPRCQRERIAIRGGA